MQPDVLLEQREHQVIEVTQTDHTQEIHRFVCPDTTNTRTHNNFISLGRKRFLFPALLKKPGKKVQLYFPVVHTFPVNKLIEKNIYIFTSLARFFTLNKEYFYIPGTILYLR